MKLSVKRIITATLALGMLLSTPVQAATNEAIEHTFYGTTVEIGGEQLPSFAKTKEYGFVPYTLESILKGDEGNFLNQDMPVYVKDAKGNVFIQMEALKFASWNNWAPGSLEDGHQVQEFTIDSKIATVNGQTVIIEEPMDINGTIYLPLKFVGLFCHVRFDGNTNSITLQHPKYPVKTEIFADHHAAVVTSYCNF